MQAVRLVAAPEPGQDLRAEIERLAALYERGETNPDTPPEVQAVLDRLGAEYDAYAAQQGVPT